MSKYVAIYVRKKAACVGRFFLLPVRARVREGRACVRRGVRAGGRRACGRACVRGWLGNKNIATVASK